MANLTETPVYDSGVYQLETADPVQGGASGVANTPLKNLANRTAYLKQHVDALEAAFGGLAPLASPTFTGDAKAPTPALGDNDTSIATTAFVQASLGGRLVKNVAGGANVTLTAAEAGNAIIELTGALTANIAVIVPSSITRGWIIKNATSGAFSVTVKTAAGTGVVCSQSANAGVWTDGTNVYDSLTDFDSIAMTGTPTAPTPTPGDNTTKVATTAFVAGAVGTLQANSVLKDSSTGAAQLPVGSVAQRPANGPGKLRYNSESSRFEGNNGSAWGSLGGATGGGTDAVFYLNDQTVNNSYTVPANQNAMSAGPITIANGATVTVSDGSVWTIV